MLLSYPSLRKHEHAFAHFSGLTLAEFETLYAHFEPAWVAAETQRLSRHPRQRALGGGGDYRLTLETRLLMVLVWLRHSVTSDASGYLFGVSQSTASRNLTRTLPVLASVAADSLHQPPSPPGLRRSWRQLQQAEPDLFAILDATEQSVNRPKTRPRRAYTFRANSGAPPARPPCRSTKPG